MICTKESGAAKTARQKVAFTRQQNRIKRLPIGR
jgi:hypothetical protein